MTRFENGDLVRDEIRFQTGVVRAVNGDVLTVVSPAGMEWRAMAHHCRPPTDREDERHALRLELVARKVGVPEGETGAVLDG
jgi:hypothetical protein